MFDSKNKYQNASIDQSVIKDYNKNRSYFSRKYICWAPFKNMYLNIHGMVMPCWLTYTDPDYYPEKSLHDIWFGEKFNNIRNHIKNYDLSKKCRICDYNIKNKNFYSALSRAYDVNYSRKKYPVMMELELDNICNLECIMCNGELSSSIRKNREKREPRKSPYGEKFIEEIKEFIPHLKEIRFNGGEPFLHPLAYKLWELIIKNNPKTKIVIATNGTILNENVKKILKKGIFHINFSIDSLQKKVYEQIRINADFDEVIKNLNYFHNYCKEKKSSLSILVNPMRQNWSEMPDFINFCNERNIPVWFNTVQHPEQYALWSLKADELEKIYNQLSTCSFSGKPIIKESYHNAKVYENFLQKQVKIWLSDAIDRNTAIKDNQDNSDNNSEELFFNKIQKKLEKEDPAGNAKEKTEQIKNIINQVFKQVPKNIDRNYFFTLAKEIPAEHIIREISSSDIEFLAKMLIKFTEKSH